MCACLLAGWLVRFGVAWKQTPFELHPIWLLHRYWISSQHHIVWTHRITDFTLSFSRFPVFLWVMSILNDTLRYNRFLLIQRHLWLFLLSCKNALFSNANWIIKLWSTTNGEQHWHAPGICKWEKEKERQRLRLYINGRFTENCIYIKCRSEAINLLDLKNDGLFKISFAFKGTKTIIQGKWIKYEIIFDTSKHWRRRLLYFPCHFGRIGWHCVSVCIQLKFSVNNRNATNNLGTVCKCVMRLQLAFKIDDSIAVARYTKFGAAHTSNRLRHTTTASIAVALYWAKCQSKS